MPTQFVVNESFYTSEHILKIAHAVRRHVSGHASKTELKELVQKINPTKITPIHTEKPKAFEEIFEGKTILPKYGEPIEI